MQFLINFNFRFKFRRNNGISVLLSSVELNTITTGKGGKCWPMGSTSKVCRGEQGSAVLLFVSPGIT